MIILPDKKSMMWLQNNRSDVLGTLVSSFNLNLTEQLGKTKISQRMVITTNAISNLGTIVAFKEYGGDLYGIGGGYAWKATDGLLRTAFSQLGSAITTAVSDTSDMEIYNNNIYVSASEILYRLHTDGSATNIGSLFTAGNPTKLLRFDKTNLLYFAYDFTAIGSMDTSESTSTSGASTITSLANTDLQITSLLQTDTLIWILTINPQNATGYVYTWDGVTANTPTDIIPLDSRGALVGIVKDNTPYIIDTDGKLMYHNGQTFVLAPNGQLPIKTTKYLINPLSDVNNRWIHPNGITLVNGRINILVNNENYDNARTIQEFLPSGIWEYVENGAESFWYHKAALTLYDLSGANAVIDYGQNRLERVGALTNFKVSDNTSATTVGTILASANYYFDSSISDYASAIFTNDSLDLIQKYGYLVTTKIMSGNVQDTWSNLYLKIRPLLSGSDAIYVKYRSTDDIATEVSITWVSQSSFTTTSNISSYIQGNEVEILNGDASGWCPNIVSITNNSTSYLVTLDQVFPNVAVIGQTARARFQTWNSTGNPFNSQNKSLASFMINKTSPWIQLKVCFLFTGNDEMIDMTLINEKIQ